MLKHYKSVIYLLCGYGLCMVAYFRANGTGPQWNAAIYWLGIAVLPIILVQYKAKDFIKPPYIIWSVLYAIATPFIVNKWGPTDDYRFYFTMMVIEGGVCGFLLIRDIHTIIQNGFKKTFGKFTVPVYILILFAVMTVVSVCKSVWPAYFTIVFVSLYMAPVDKKEMGKIFLSVCDALIICFFIIQSHAFLFRPFDVPRYVGFFNNPNVNAMFYFVCYIAWLGRYVWARQNKKKAIEIVTFLFSGAMWSFVLLTACRSVLVAYLLSTLTSFILLEFMMFKTKIKGFLLRGFGLFLVFVISFPIVFACVRYIPPLRHHPIWFGDYREDSVFSWDPIDSEKYTDLKEFFDELLGRIDPNRIEAEGIDLNNPDRDTQQKIDAVSYIDVTLPDGVVKRYRVVDTVADNGNEAPGIDYYSMGCTSGYLWEGYRIVNCEMKNEDTVAYYEDGVEPGTDEHHPAYTHQFFKTYERILGMRKYVYGYFFNRLNLLGHEQEYPSAYLFFDYHVLHSHNTYLQASYVYGVPAGILFIALTVYTAISILAAIIRNKQNTKWYYIFALCAYIGAVSISLMENIFFPGKMMLTLVFLCILPVANRRKHE